MIRVQKLRFFPHLSNPIQAIIVINGVYDLACAFCIVYLPNTLLGKLHTNMYQDITKKEKQSLLTIIFVFGCMRLYSGIFWTQMYQEDNNTFAILSYFLEALYFEYKVWYGRVIPWKGHFVSISSILLALMCLRN